MVVEKQVAFAQSMLGMWLAGARAQQDLWLSLSRAMVQPPWFRPVAGGRLARQVNQAGLDVLSKGLAPIQRKASANARRLSRTKGR